MEEPEARRDESYCSSGSMTFLANDNLEHLVASHRSLIGITSMHQKQTNITCINDEGSITEDQALAKMFIAD